MEQSNGKYNKDIGLFIFFKLATNCAWGLLYCEKLSLNFWINSKGDKPLIDLIGLSWIIFISKG